MNKKEIKEKEVSDEADTVEEIGKVVKFDTGEVIKISENLNVIVKKVNPPRIHLVLEDTTNRFKKSMKGRIILLKGIAFEVTGLTGKTLYCTLST